MEKLYAYIIFLVVFLAIGIGVVSQIKYTQRAITALTHERPFSEKCAYPTSDSGYRMRVNNYGIDDEVWYLDNDEVKQGYFKDVVIKYEVYEDDRRYFTDLSDNIFISKEALIDSL